MVHETFFRQYEGHNNYGNSNNTFDRVGLKEWQRNGVG